MSDPDVVIAGAARTPIGAMSGALAAVPAPKLGAIAIRAACERAGVEPEAVEEVIMGQVLAAGAGQAPARQAALAAGIPDRVGATTINKMCGSGMKAVMLAAQAVRLGEAKIVAAGGMENMSRAPYLLEKARAGYRLGHGRLVDSMITDGLWDVTNDFHMGCAAELCARKYEFTRAMQDEYASESYRRAQQAEKDGLFSDEIAPVEIPGRKGNVTVTEDEEPNRVDFARIADLRPAFEEGGTVTAANASTIADGAAALVVTSAEEAARRGLAPLARIVASASTAKAPEWFTTAPVDATRAVLEKAGLEIGQIDLFEVNEAFAAVPLAAAADLGIDRARMNVHGGAVSLGHPIGASGARILVTLLYAMKQQHARRGLAAICIGGGEATAIILDRG